MAQKRMFSKQIVSSDAFMDMPQSTQLLYFHLSMEADDDGFIGNAKRVMRMIGANDDDYKILIAKRFILQFEESICVIKHWLIHNYIQADRYHETKYIEQKKLLTIKENKAYTERGETRLITAKEKKELKPYTIPEWLDGTLWDAWVQYRKEKRKALTEKAIELNIKFLEQHKEDHKQIIEQSIGNGWTGLFELKEGRTKTKGGIKI